MENLLVLATNLIVPPMCRGTKSRDVLQCFVKLHRPTQYLVVESREEHTPVQFNSHP
jgi:hypothetical protein